MTIHMQKLIDVDGFRVFYEICVTFSSVCRFVKTLILTGSMKNLNLQCTLKLKPFTPHESKAGYLCAVLLHILFPWNSL